MLDLHILKYEAAGLQSYDIGAWLLFNIIVVFILKYNVRKGKNLM